jgi:hypothetical protein
LHVTAGRQRRDGRSDLSQGLADILDLVRPLRDRNLFTYRAIFGSGNGIARVDETWFERALDDEVRGIPVQLIPAEETASTTIGGSCSPISSSSATSIPTTPTASRS